MKSVRPILAVAAAAVVAVPAASAAPELTRVSIAPAATYVSPGLINVEISVACEAGQTYFAGADVLQQGPFGSNFGNGSTQGVCTGGRQKVAISVFSFGGPWQLGDASARVFACAFACDDTSREIRIVL